MDTPEELRIIAKDAVLAGQDREAIKRAADEYEMLARQLIAIQAALIESQARQIATNDALITLRAKHYQGVAMGLKC